MTNKIGVVIVGIDQFEKYTLPLVKDIRAFEPDIHISIIDNASKEPYPIAGIRLEKRVSYAEAINISANTFFNDMKYDWILSMNNDVACKGKFSHMVENLSHDKIYARQIIEEKGFVWFGNWIVLIPKEVWSKVGEFDKNFEMCGFEDADYSIRAMKLGIPTVPIDLPFFHYWGKTRWDLPKYPEVRIKNQEYLALKHGVLLGNDVRVTHD